MRKLAPELAPDAAKRGGIGHDSDAGGMLKKPGFLRQTGLAVTGQYTRWRVYSQAIMTPATKPSTKAQTAPVIVPTNVGEKPM